MGWFASGLRIKPPAPNAVKPAGASPALLEQLLEAGETELSDAAELTGTYLTGEAQVTGDARFVGEAEPTGESELMETVDLVDAADFADRAEAANAELPRGGIDLKDHLSAIEIGLIRKALVEADGTVAEAARLLRMRRTTLVEKLRKYRLSA
jgi:DNA-binding NtrC family response regulator